ncbi:MAG: PIN domain-containing protein [Chloroflexi bacterium]|nr:PIN domain-containing protein [Chloroflexota bacterium]
MRWRQPPLARGGFLDSSAYFAIVDRDDASHQAAQAILRRVVERRARLVTTSFVLAEAHALILNRLNRDLATRFLHDLLQGSTTLIWVMADDVQQAAEIIDQYDDKEFSLTDATSFVVMKGLEITHAFTFDDHFSQYGLTVLTPDNF